MGGLAQNTGRESWEGSHRISDPTPQDREVELSYWPRVTQLLSRKCTVTKQASYLLVLLFFVPIDQLIISIHKAHTPLALDFGVIHCH